MTSPFIDKNDSPGTTSRMKAVTQTHVRISFLETESISVQHQSLESGVWISRDIRFRLANIHKETVFQKIWATGIRYLIKRGKRVRVKFLDEESGSIQSFSKYSLSAPEHRAHTNLVHPLARSNRVLNDRYTGPMKIMYHLDLKMWMKCSRSPFQPGGIHCHKLSFEPQIKVLLVAAILGYIPISITRSCLWSSFEPGPNSGIGETEDASKCLPNADWEVYRLRHGVSHPCTRE
ncbi:hypothetical protein EV421DRAFT_1743985 [Armillaria borealis]|uniref:Uncharacterized protein n=1 Tax=Armillaria borealis TaxID=47425 RepID=A0AA39MEF9_9AGAR|nr:hypothetical protein EV421DRAFT_1743985 [Armillaria borealis]